MVTTCRLAAKASSQTLVKHCQTPCRISHRFPGRNRDPRTHRRSLLSFLPLAHIPGMGVSAAGVGGRFGGTPRTSRAPPAPAAQGKAKGAARPPALLAPKPLPVKKVTRGWGNGDSSRKPPAAPGDTEGRQPAGWQLPAGAHQARRHGLPAAPAARPRLQGDFRALQRLRPHGRPARTPPGGGR